ncbi:hypothetical protein EAO77_36695 [Streptomyces sp. t39]|nr:hypothetical protein EAO77_36695 [Streptomyces sp. t39]
MSLLTNVMEHSLDDGYAEASGRTGGEPVLRTGGGCDMPHIVARRSRYRRMAPPVPPRPRHAAAGGTGGGVTSRRCPRPRPTRRAGPGRRCRPGPRPTDG